MRKSPFLFVTSLTLFAFLSQIILFDTGLVMAHDGQAHGTVAPPSGMTSTDLTNAQSAAQNLVNGHNTNHTTTPTTPPAHQDDPVKRDEHNALLLLAQDDHATVIIDTNTTLSQLEADGKAVDGAKIVIKENVSLVIDKESTHKFEWIRVDGVLKFATDKNTSLSVVTLIVNVKGTLEIGTKENRIQEGVTAKLFIADRGERTDAMREIDPFDLTGGLISHGKTVMAGSEYTSHKMLADTPKAGDTELRLTEAATGWKAGDYLVIASERRDQNQDEELLIKSISADGKLVTLESALKFNHAMDVPLANITRNIIIASENVTDISRRGHVMFMHSMNVDIDSAGFYGLGRTDGRQAVTDPTLDSEGHLLKESDKNTRGRYAVHFHMRTGADKAGSPAVIRNSAVVDSPKFGIVNHGAHVLIEKNVTYDIDGSHIFLENGSEIGTVSGNLGIRARGNAFEWLNPETGKIQIIRDGQESRKMIFDFGFNGHFLWAQGGGVDVTDNFAAGMADAAYIFFTTTVKEGGKSIAFQVKNLRDSELKANLEAKGIKEIAVDNVPFYFARNKATTSRLGFESKFHLLSQNDASARSILEDSLFWNNAGGSSNEYTNQLTIRNSQFIGDVNNPRGTAFVRNDVTRNLIYDHLTVEGWGVGINIPVNGTNRVIGGTFNNVRDIVITSAMSKNRLVDIDARDLSFGVLSAEALKKAGATAQHDIFMSANFRPKSGDISLNFNRDQVVVTADGDNILLNGKQIYFEEQAPDFIPFKQVTDATGKVLSNTLTGTELDGMTNQEMWDKFRLAIAGAMAPADAFRDPRIKGLIGEKAVYDPDLSLVTSRFTMDLNYVLKVKDSSGKVITLDAQPLKENSWNLLRVEADGLMRTVLIYNDTIAPTFVPDANMIKPENMRIHPQDIQFGIKIKGQVTDQVGLINTSEKFEKVFKLAKDPANPKAGEFVISQDGQSILVRGTVSDKAGNKTPFEFIFSIDSNAPIRNGNVGFFGQPSYGKKLPPRLVSKLVSFIKGFQRILVR